MAGRHFLAPLFDPAGVMLVVASPNSACDPAWAAPIRARFVAEAAAGVAGDSAASAIGRVHGPARRIVPLETARDEPPGSDCELALIATPIAQAAAALDLAAAHGARAAVVLDRCEDRALAQTLLERARARQIRLLGPESMGVVCPALRLDASRLGRLPAAGNVALVSQSGVLAGAILDWAGESAIGFSLVASMGLELDVDLAQVLDYLAGDPRTKAVVVYLEAVGEARGFMSALRALATVKPVVVLKAGRDASTGPNARTHSGAIVGSDAVYSAALRRAGAVQVRLFTQLFTAVRYLAARNWPLGKRLAIVSNGHGPAMLAADQAFSQGIRLHPFGEATRTALHERLAGVEARNPLDLGADADAERFVGAIEALARDADSDALLVLVSPVAGSDLRTITERVATASQSFAKPLFACWLGDSSMRELRGRLDAAGLPVFRTPEAAVDAFCTVATFHENQLLLQQAPRSLSGLEAPDVAGARGLIDAVLAQGREVLTEVESKALLAAFRIPVTPTVLARDADQAERIAGEIGYPVVMKIASPDVIHKSEAGGVSLNVRNAAEVRTQFAAILNAVRSAMPGARIDGVTLQPMVHSRGARELYAGVSRNPLFGPVIAFGAGGTQVEVMRDTTLEFPPLNAFLAHSMIGRTRDAATLREFRRAPAVDEEALARILMRVSEMVCELPQLAEMDINPLIADARGAIAVDARIVLDPSPMATGRRYGHMAIMPYPAHLSRQEKLRDGRICLLRPIQAEDAERLQRFTRGLSQQSRYFRFISTLNELTPRMLVRYTQIDYDRELALVAVCQAEDAGSGDRERIVGVARYLLNADRESCEFAIAIGDEYQGQGLGSTLMRALIEVAGQRGLKRMEGYVLAINTPMIRLMRALGFTIDRDPDDETMKLVWLALGSSGAAPESAVGTPQPPSSAR